MTRRKCSCGWMTCWKVRAAAGLGFRDSQISCCRACMLAEVWLPCKNLLAAAPQQGITPWFHSSPQPWLVWRRGEGHRHGRLRVAAGHTADAGAGGAPGPRLDRCAADVCVCVCQQLRLPCQAFACLVPLCGFSRAQPRFAAMVPGDGYGDGAGCSFRVSHSHQTPLSPVRSSDVAAVAPAKGNGCSCCRCCCNCAGLLLPRYEQREETATDLAPLAAADHELRGAPVGRAAHRA